MEHTMIFDAGKGLASFPHLRVFKEESYETGK